MEEKLINAVKNHEYLYNKSLLLYRNKFKRAAAWNSISKELNLPEEACQSRWRSLRDKFVKTVAESHHASGSGAEIPESQWQYKEQMEFLREHVKPRKTVTSLTLPKNPNGSSTEASPSQIFENSLSQSIESLIETSFSEAECSQDQPSVSTPTLNSESNSLPFEGSSSSKKRTRRECNSEAFTDFLSKMSKIAETRFAVQKESGVHDGFYAMVTEIFGKLTNDEVQDAKFFFIDYLRDQVAKKKC